MEAVGLYIKCDFLSQMSKKDTVVLFQLFRLINSLEFWMKLFLVVPKEKYEIFEHRNKIELFFGMISCYKEATKEFSNNLARDILNMNLSESLCEKISNYNAWLENWKQDEYLSVVHRIRNDIRFHMKSSIYDKFIKEGNKSKDCLFGISIGEQYKDFIYVEPYTFEIAHIAEIVPVNVGDELDWVQQRSSEEASKMVKLLREIIQELLKGNVYKKNVDV